jgi:hypothetical protein
MFDDHSPDHPLRRFTQQDLLASGLRVALSAAGPFGAIVGEFLTQFVPAQRLDRLQQFVDCLAERLDRLESDFRERISSSPGYAALVEEAAVSAVKAASDNHRRDLAWLLTNGLSMDEAELLDAQALLRLRDRITDAQVILLMSYGNFRRTMGDSELHEFQSKHPGLFDRNPPTMSSSEEHVRRWSLSEHYRAELETLGLFRDTEGEVNSSRSRKYEITVLGKALLTAIGRYRDPHPKSAA